MTPDDATKILNQREHRSSVWRHMAGFVYGTHFEGPNKGKVVCQSSFFFADEAIAIAEKYQRESASERS